MRGLTAMLVSALISLIIGLILALRFRVLVLIPVFLLALVFALATGIPMSSVFGTMVMVIIGLQMGYAAGIALRHLRLLLRANRMRAASAAKPLRAHSSAQ